MEGYMSLQAYENIIRELESKADNAARRNKPTMWAYFLEMRSGLLEWFSDVQVSDGGYAGAALALSQKAVEECPTLSPSKAARLWALSVYARRILQGWSGRRERVSLKWLKDRQLAKARVPV